MREPLNLEHTIVKFKECIINNNFDDLHRVTGGTECTCYTAYSKGMYNKAILKKSQNRNKEDKLLKEFSHLKSIPELYWSDGKNSIVEFFCNDRDYHPPTDEQVKQLIEDYYYIAKAGYLLCDMSSRNILFNREQGYKIIDLGDYNEVRGVSGADLFYQTENRLWGTLNTKMNEERVQTYKDYALSILTKESGIEREANEISVDFRKRD